MQWSPLHIDALAEIFNVGVGRAAGVLYEMIGQEIELSVPSVSFLDRGDLDTMLMDEMPGDVVAIRQSFSGDLGGSAVLFFVEESSIQLVRMLLDDDLSGEEIAELEAEALSELGNILLNGCLGAVANTLGKELEIALPVFFKGDPQRAIPDARAARSEPSIVVRISLRSHPSGIGGLIVLFMDGPAQVRLRRVLDDFLSVACA